MRLFSQFEGFEWDEGNRNKNWHRHKVHWWECEELFFHQPLYIYSDERHSAAEDRYYALGRTNTRRLLLIVFTHRRKKIRIISTRDMHKKERHVYREKAKKDTSV